MSNISFFAMNCEFFGFLHKTSQNYADFWLFLMHILCKAQFSGFLNAVCNEKTRAFA